MVSFFKKSEVLKHEFINKMIKINVGNKIILIDLFDIDFENWMRISKYIIERYGFKFWLESSYYIRHKDELEEKETQEASEWMMKHYI